MPLLGSSKSGSFKGNQYIATSDMGNSSDLRGFWPIFWGVRMRPQGREARAQRVGGWLPREVAEGAKTIGFPLGFCFEPPNRKVSGVPENDAFPFGGPFNPPKGVDQKQDTPTLQWLQLLQLAQLQSPHFENGRAMRSARLFSIPGTP